MGMMVQYARLRLREALGRFVKDEQGLEMIEIILIAALVIVGSIALWRFLGTGMKARLYDLCNNIAPNHCGAAPEGAGEFQ